MDWPVTVLTDYGSIGGQIKNITLEGVLILCEEPLRLNETYQMSISPPDGKAIGVTGKVVWSDAYCMDENNLVNTGGGLLSAQREDNGCALMLAAMFISQLGPRMPPRNRTKV